ncbi:unnamed protein product [Schistocephalus solidus]|uniref:Protein kinase domain-containing protein n=1 Tax=Schistocephalus solidus TaxID=70667 RepID=A0A183STG5_SCHSO|nr:unnamed protein product [Schistocephalus solidus]
MSFVGKRLFRKKSADKPEKLKLKLQHSEVTPETVLALSRPTNGYLCSNSANIYGIQFTHFTLRDMDSNNIIVDLARPFTELGTFPNANGIVRYKFPASFLLLKTIGATLVQYLCLFLARSTLISDSSYLMVCILYVYITIYLVQAMISCPNETKSDSFYFVNDTLVMHNKAEYSYCA